MAVREKPYEEHLIQFVKKQYISIGMVVFMTIILTISYNFSTSIIAPLYFPIRNQSHTSMEVTLAQITSTTTTANKPITNVTSKTTTTTTRNLDEILCDNRTSFHLSSIPSNPCARVRCVVVLRHSGGRLGNRMFMFASAYGLARAHHCHLYVSETIRAELGSYFQMHTIDSSIWLTEREFNLLKNIEIKDTVCSFFPDLMKVNGFQYIELHGYWQSYLHFDGYREEIREIFTARNETLVRLAKYFTELIQQFCSLCSPLPHRTHEELRQALRTRFNIVWISIHIRRTDIISHGCASDEQYIYSAMQFYRRRYYQENIRFLVASDDRPYCRQILAHENYSGQVFILPNDFSPIDDLIALSLCHHSIVTVGTFGFWTGYLAGGTVVHDVKCREDCLQVEYYPPWFILMGTPKTRKTRLR